jgi:hypothetical protein
METQERRLTRFRQTTTWSNEHEGVWQFTALWMGTLYTISQDIYRYTDESCLIRTYTPSRGSLSFPDNFQLLELGHRTHHSSVFKGIRDRHEFCSDSQPRRTGSLFSLKHLSAALLYKFRLLNNVNVNGVELQQ